MILQAFKFYTFFFWLTCTYVISGAITVSNGAQEIDFIEPQPIKRSPPTYPREEQRVANSGMVELYFMVDEDGNTFEPIVERSTRQSFEDHAIKAVSEYKYSPATLNGKPIESRQSIRIAFEIQDSGDDVNSKFARSYRKFNGLFAKEKIDPKRLSSLISRMESAGNMTPYAYAYLNLVRLQYANKFGQIGDQIEATEQLLLFEGRTGKKGRFIKEDLRVGLRRNLVGLNIEAQRYGAALDAFSRLEGIDSEARKLYGAALEKIREISNNDALIVVDIKIPKRSYTGNFLFKKNFSIMDVDGKIDALKLRCRNKFSELAFKQQAEYQIPKSWGKCHLQILGTQDTSAKLVQF